MVLVTAMELGWWTVTWGLSIAPAAHVGGYLLLAFAGLATAMALRFAVNREVAGASLPAILLGTMLTGIGASAFLPLKYAIPKVIPFWLDQPLAQLEFRLFGVQPWRMLDHALWWATRPLDWLYGAWLPTQSLIMFSVMLARPSKEKSRALIAYSAAWFLLGVVAALFLSSAGPLFFDRLFGGATFAGLAETLRARGAWVALAESGAMWRSLATGHPGLVAGISAVPSLHVAISLWVVLVARSMTPRFATPALVYFALVFLASVQLGWHYVSDGVIGAVGMLVVWKLAAAPRKQPPNSGGRSNPQNCGDQAARERVNSL